VLLVAALILGVFLFGVCLLGFWAWGARCIVSSFCFLCAVAFCGWKKQNVLAICVGLLTPYFWGDAQMCTYLFRRLWKLRGVFYDIG